MRLIPIVLALAACGSQPIPEDPPTSNVESPLLGIALFWRGPYSATAFYTLSDAVSNGGSSYVCATLHCSHQTPAIASADWQLLAQQGADGAAGAQGAQGDAGSAGPVGPAGSDGPVGPAGPIGMMGMMGLTGPQGDVGPVGATGVAGLQGMAGATGAQGPQGIAGATGAQGPAGPAGSSTIQIAPTGWLAFSSVDGQFYGASLLARSTQAPHGGSLFWTTNVSWQPTTTFTDELVVPTNVDVGYALSGAVRQTLIRLAPTTSSDPVHLVEYDLDPAHLGEIVATHPNLPMPIARAGLNADGSTGGYNHLRNDLFWIKVTNSGVAATADLMIGQSGQSSHVAVELDTVLGASYEACPRGYANMIHDPASRRIVISDSCNDVLWVLGYSQQQNAITLKGMIRPPSIGHLGYDPAHHMLWTGSYGIQVDLSTF